MALRVLLKGRLFAKQGWIFTNDYAETDDRGLPRPHVFTLGAGEVIEGLEVGCLGMREGGVRRVVASPPASYRDKARSSRRGLFALYAGPHTTASAWCTPILLRTLLPGASLRQAGPSLSIPTPLDAFRLRV